MCTSESCGCTTATTDTTPTATDGVRTTYTVAGMTCGGCANRVSERVSAVASVTGVQIDVASGEVTVTSDTTLPTADVRAAVEQAGYRLAS
jgi:copper chaperone CopZ